VVVPSGFLQRVVAEFGIHARIIPNIIDLNTFGASDTRAARQRGESDPYVVVVTRNLEPIYGIATAIQCIARARAAIPGITLKIAGSGPQLDELQQLVVQLGLEDCVHFLGRLDRTGIVALYHEADVMLNPSLVDNMPNSVLEALACGVPVVSTNVGGVPYLVEDNQTALLVDPQNPDAMASALTRLHADTALQNGLREAGLKLASRFAWPQVKGQWLALYRSGGEAA
jgi:glycosyltransferase involved in cell wall biosynthesis